MIGVYHNGRYLFDRVKSEINWFFKENSIADLRAYEYKKHSQNREDGMISAVFKQLSVFKGYYVEIGCGDGVECNTLNLKEKGWQGVWIDAEQYGNPNVRKEFVTAENVNAILEKYCVPKSFDFLSIDIDGNDYWVWEALAYNPKLVVIEYDACCEPDESKVMPYDAGYVWDRQTRNFGTSLKSMNELAESKGYELVGVDNRRVNAFFVRKDLVNGNFCIEDRERFYVKSKWGMKFVAVFGGEEK